MQFNDNTRVCSLCKRTLLISEFYLRGDDPNRARVRSHCKQCLAEKNRRKQQKAAAKRKAEREKLVPPGFRKCKTCHAVKPIDDFSVRVKRSGRQTGQSQYQTSCKPCVAVLRRAYLVQNFDKIRAARKKRYTLNADKIKTEVRNYRQRYRDQILAKLKAWYRSNRERSLAASAKYREEHKDEIARYCSDWRRAHRDECRAYEHTKRALKKQNGGSYTKAEWRSILRRFQNRCVCCGIRGKDTPQKYLTVDHVVPISRGGTNDISNIQPLCHSCNSRKGPRHSADYRQTPFVRNAQLALISLDTTPKDSPHWNLGRRRPCPNESGPWT